MRVLAFLLIGVVAVYCKDALRIEVSDKHGAYGSDTELVNIDLKHADANTNGVDDIKIQVKLYFHLVNNQVHCNGVPLQHQKVTHLHMQMTLQEIHEGEEVKNERDVPVELRVFVGEEMVNGKQVLFVEQQFLMIDAQRVTQITIQKVMWEEFVKKPTVPLEFANTRLAQQNEKDDKHVYSALPRLPQHPYSGEDREQMYEHHHHHHGHHRHHSVKCWFKHLHKRSKIAVVTGGAFVLIGLVFAIACFVRRRKIKTQTLVISAPIDDSVIVDVNEKKNVKDEEKFDFHFEMDNAVVVDDKKVLISE